MAKVKKAGQGGRKRKANGYELPDPLPLGLVLTDIGKKQWRLGPSIGKGGFGEIYSACEEGTQSKTYPFAVKIEPHANGPLFVEKSFFIKVLKPEKLEEWKKKKKKRVIGLPSLQGFGSQVYNGKNYRFIVMERLDKDLQSLWLDSGKKLPARQVLLYSIQILDALEYIHSTGYVHADIKGANLLFGYAKGTEDDLFLVDFGLARKYSQDKEFKVDPKRAHDGTIEYTSTHMHQGVATRRGDLEILAYNILHWMGCSLPWDNCLTDPQKVFTLKSQLISSPRSQLSSNSSLPPVVLDYLEYVSKMDHLEEPDYDRCRNLFERALSKLPEGSKNSKAAPKTRKGRSKSRSRPLRADSEGDEENVEENLSPSKRPKRNGCASWRSAPLCEPGKISTSKKKVVNPSSAKTKKTNQAEQIKPSWRDCPTIKAGARSALKRSTNKNS